MIIRTRGGDVEFRSQEWGNSSQLPQAGQAWVANSGIALTTEAAYGLPAVSNVMRSPSEVIASLPFMVYQGKPRRRAETTWQWQLLHEDPDDLSTGTYQFFYDLEMSLEGYQNAFIQKAVSRRRIEALYVIDPDRVSVYRDKNGEKRFDVYVNGTETRTYDSREILHVRGFTPKPGHVCGVSLIQTHRDAIGSSVALQGFEGDYFRNSAQPPFFFTGAKNKEHAADLVEAHQSRHQGVGNQFKVGAVWGMTDVKTLPISMVDAEYIQAKQMSVEEACRIWRWPKELMELTSASAGRPPADENQWISRTLKFYILPRLKRIERAFASDPDLFGMSGLVGEFMTAYLERADFITRMQGYKDARQGGWATANEIRDMENLPPRSDGDSLLETPTGSAPNAGASTGGKQKVPADKNGAAAHSFTEEMMLA